MARKVLVTGGAGFIGSNIAKRLVQDGRRVIVLDNLATGSDSNVPQGAEFIKGDIGDYELPNQEDSKLNPMSPYAVGKIADEYYLKSYANMYGLEPIIFRIFNAFGPGQDPNNAEQGITGYLIGCLFQDKEFVLQGDGQQTRDYIYIGEVVEAFVRAEKIPAAINQIMNLAGNTRTSLNDWIALIEEAANKKLKIKTGQPDT